MPVVVTPALKHRVLSRAGYRGGKNGSKTDKARAGHASRAVVFRRIAKEEAAAGHHDLAAEYIAKAEQQERLAK